MRGSQSGMSNYILKDGRKLSIQAKRILGEEHELRVLKSGAGYYIGTASDEDGPISRDSGYYPTAEAAAAALEHDTFTARVNP